MRRRRSPIAIDFGEHAVKVLQLEQQADRLCVRAAGAAVVDHASSPTNRRERLIDAGRRALRGRAFRGGTAHVALRLADIATRHVRLPTEGLTDAGNTIANLVQEQDDSGRQLAICPLPIADLFDQGAHKREYLCCIAADDAIQELIAITEAVGLRPAAIDLAPCAQARTALHAAPNDSFVHLDFGRDSTRFVVVRAGETVLMRSVAIGGTALITALEQRLQLDFAAVLALAADPAADGALLQDTVVHALAEPLEPLLHRVADGIRYCGALFHGRAVTALRVSGGLARLPGLVPYLGRRIGITAEPVDPFAGLSGDLAAYGALPRQHDFTTAVGLALGGLPA